MSQISISNLNDNFTTISLREISGDSFTLRSNTVETTINISSDLNRTSNDSILAYRPNYHDIYSSYLVTVYVHVKTAYPCASQDSGVSCKVFPNEGGGFGPILEAMDKGANFDIFNGTTYTFAFEGCSQITEACTHLPSGFFMEFTLIGLLPSSQCYNT